MSNLGSEALLVDLSVIVDAPRDVVWPLLTDPERMNEWSLARIGALATGDADRMDTVGAWRTVTVPSPLAPLKLQEVVTASEHERMLRYRVVRGPAMLVEHRGEQTLEPVDTGTRVRWRVWAIFTPRTLRAAARRQLVPMLEKSVDRMASLAKTLRVDRNATIPPPPALAQRWIASLDLTVIRRDAERVLDEQRRIARELFEQRAPTRWFARIYQFVTEEQLAHVERGEPAHPEWVLRLIPRFHEYYARNLESWRARDALRTEPQWAASFRVVESNPEDPRTIVLGILLGVRAHIEEDLPRALADVYLRHFADRCGYARFRADYLAMESVFRRATERAMAEMPANYVPLWLRAARRVLPERLRDRLTQSRFYDVRRARVLAFERGRRWVEWAQSALIDMEPGP